MDWDDVRYFLALARTGAVRSAGAALGVSHSTVSRRVDALEETLSVRLFDRHRDGYQLTDAGREMLPGAERVEREMAALERKLLGQDDRLAGPVKLTCCDEFVADMVMDALTPLCEASPEVELCMVTDSRAFNLSMREADIAIRILRTGAQPAEHLLGLRLAPLIYASYISAAHLDQLDPDTSSSHARWLAYAERQYTEALVASSSYPDVPLWGSFSSIALMAQAARKGLGIALLPCYVGDRDPSLRRLARPDLRQVAELWLLSHPDLRTNTRLRMARAQVSEALKTLAPLFRGDAPLPRPPAHLPR